MLEKDPNNVGTHLNFALLLQNNFQEYDLARQHLEKVLELDPKNKTAHQHFARLLRRHFPQTDLSEIFDQFKVPNRIKPLYSAEATNDIPGSPEFVPISPPSSPNK